MKKILSALAFICIPFSINAAQDKAFIRAYKATYAVTAKQKLPGTSERSVSYNGNQVTLESNLQIKAKIKTVVIHQKEEVVLNNGEPSSKKLTIDSSIKNKSKSLDLPNGYYGSLATIYSLQDNLLTNSKFPLVINKFQNKKFQPLKFSIKNSNEIVKTALGEIATTKISATADNGDVISFWFANNHKKYNAVMVKSLVIKNGKPNIVSVLSNYQTN